jgi:hypothetical protein
VLWNALRRKIKKGSIQFIRWQPFEFFMEAASGFEPENNGFADRCLTTWLCRHKKMERETGFEPATSTLARLHSTTELFPLAIGYFKKSFPPLSRGKAKKAHGTLRMAGKVKALRP